MTWREAVPMCGFMADSMPEESESTSSSDDADEPISWTLNADVTVIESRGRALLAAVKESSRQDMKSWMEL